MVLLNARYVANKIQTADLAQEGKEEKSKGIKGRERSV